jgi:hypothetical protein
MAIEFNKHQKLIVVTSGQTTVTIQELINEIRDYEDNGENMELAQIANATGKQDLGGGTSVGITLELINNWRIAFSGWQGPDEKPVFVTGGNTVATNVFNNNPIAASGSPFTYATVQQSTSPSIAGVTAAEIASAVWDANTATHTSGTTFGEKVGQKLLTFIKFMGAK